MPLRLAPFLGVFFLGPILLSAAAPDGIPRQLARERAALISDIRYHLAFHLADPDVAGEEELGFRLKEARPVLLDFRDGRIDAVVLNGTPVSPDVANGHLELPASALHAGENTAEIKFRANIAAAGKPVTRYEDREDGTVYIYSLFVPMDASMAFPCFDQPDLKGRFRFELWTPEDWAAISNGEVTGSAKEPAGQGPGYARHTTFAETPPISTYLFAFAAGHFRKVHDTPGLPGLYVRQSQLKRAEAEAPDVQQITARGIEYLSNYFARPFPFSKYDLVLIPGLAYGGMEHPGATFLREESVLFRAAPTHSDLLGRDTLLLHELTHQWFGDLTTMQWFDDLWLKEGFAQYMAYQALASLKPGENIWKRFYESIKPSAYAIDSTKGTTPIYQDIPNLKDAKSAYGAIVYSKAPAVLKQLAFVLGGDNFRNGLRLYLKTHAYSNARWNDLVHALEQVSGRSLTNWAEVWIQRRGMPQVDATWSCDGARLRALALSQHDVLGTSTIWPLATLVVLGYPDSPPIELRADLEHQRLEVREAVGKPCPAFVFANDEDYAYGRFLLDPRSRDRVMQLADVDLGGSADLFRRTLLLGSLWDSVREADLAPGSYVSLAAKLLPPESDESLTRSMLGRSIIALHRYMRDETRLKLLPALEVMAAEHMAAAPDQGLRIVWFRALRSLAETAGGRGGLKALLRGELSIPGVELRPLDRWNLVTALIALGDRDADAILAAEQQRDKSGDAPKYAYAAEAARPDAKTKQKYFDDYLHDSSRPEDWIELSLGPFNSWNQLALTEPFLKPALEALPQMKRDRKIFFLMDWLTSFITPQQSPSALAVVYRYLDTAEPEKDLRLKILEAVDELDRTVAIRRKFPE